MNIKLISLSTLLALGVAGSAFAQDSTPPATPSTPPASHPMSHHMGMHHMGSNSKHDPFADLNLTADQRTKIDGIMQQAKEQAEQNRQNTDKQINEVLTPEQKTKWEADKKQRHEAWKEKKAGEKDKMNETPTPPPVPATDGKEGSSK